MNKFNQQVVSVVVICLGIGLLWEKFRYSVLIGVSILLLIVPVQMAMGKMLSKYFAQAAKLTDERIRLMNEFIPAIKIIKVSFANASKIHSSRILM